MNMDLEDVGRIKRPKIAGKAVKGVRVGALVTICPGTNPKVAAAKIKDRLGENYAAALKALL